MSFFAFFGHNCKPVFHKEIRLSGTNTQTYHDARNEAIAEEQVFVDTAYESLDRQRTLYRARLDTIRAQTGQESAGEMRERDAFATHYEDNLIRLRNVENRLVLGRLDTTSGETEYIGRISLRDEHQNIIMLDWRAPRSEPFYRATPAQPGDIRRRRHIQTRLREVVGVEDELMDSSVASSDLNLTGESALMAALNAARDGKMNDIVATIQAEQDEIIRSDSQGILVVQGGPGTGKTAVALHRAAYLLYTLRDTLSRSGVLIVGPSPVFLRYIDRVLPSLGESDVVSTTIENLVPGVKATRCDTPEVAEIKGRLVWRDIARRAVPMILQKPLPKPVNLRISEVNVRLTPQDVESAQRIARRGGRLHNEARETYAKQLVEVLADQIAAIKKIDLADNLWIYEDIAESRDARREINLRWLPSSAQSLLERLYANPALLERVAPELSAQERQALKREKGSGFSAGDIAIIDELYEYLGTFLTAKERAYQRAQRAQDAELVSYAKETMSAMNLGAGIVTSEMLADRMRVSSHGDDLADRAALDRSWTYGHVVVDEAQELTPMQWEMIIRRNPSLSMTLVGDVDQRPAGAPSDGWEGIVGRLAQYMRVADLTISYRTPAAILDIARNVLEAHGVKVRPVTGARNAEKCFDVVASGNTPVCETVIDAIVDSCTMLNSWYEDKGTLSVIVPELRRSEIAHAVATSDALSQWTRDTRGVDVTSRIQVLTTREAKGLEFDAVVLVEPAEILAEGPGNLYVAMTRSTRHLRIVHSQPLPPGMDVKKNA